MLSFEHGLALPNVQKRQKPSWMVENQSSKYKMGVHLTQDACQKMDAFSYLDHVSNVSQTDDFNVFFCMCIDLPQKLMISQKNSSDFMLIRWFCTPIHFTWLSIFIYIEWHVERDTFNVLIELWINSFTYQTTYIYTTIYSFMQKVAGFSSSFSFLLCFFLLLCVKCLHFVHILDRKICRWRHREAQYQTNFNFICTSFQCCWHEKGVRTAA